MWQAKDHEPVVWTRTKKITYGCACVVILHDYGPQEAPLTCKIHNERIETIETTEKRYDPPRP